MQWMTLFRKEVLENWRNFKWIWVPLVFILIAIMDPISSYYLPQIIESVGGLPEGATIEIPTPTPNEVVMMSLGQLSSFGVLVIILMSMGAISGERKSGVSELILVKPVSYQNYITSKWVALLILIWSSLFIGMLGSWYYINLLFGELSFLSLLQITFFYGLWLTLVGSISIFYNTIFKSSGFIAALTIITILLMSIATQVFGQILDWSPNNLSAHIQEMLHTGSISTTLFATTFVTLGIISILLIGSIFIFNKRELAG